jgi:hypothetical protein
MQNKIVCETPLELCSLLFPNLDGVVAPDVGVIVYIFFHKTKDYYDPNCDCQKTENELKSIEEFYKLLITLDDFEKQRLIKVVGASLTLKLNGKILGTIE